MIIISPHLDDAVLSCGQLLAAHPRSTVITAFAGLPPIGCSTPFDEACGFDDSVQAMSARVAEDWRAAAVLDFTPIHLPFLDGQYLNGVDSRHELTWTLDDVLDSLPSEPIFRPLGIAHPDHEAVARSCAELNRDMLVYEELPGRVLWPQRVPQTLEQCEQVAGPVHLKEAAIGCYRSQHGLPELAPPWHACLVPERYWRRRAA